MTTAQLSDRHLLRNAVRHQLDRDPPLDASNIGVVARNGAVTLTGYVNTYAEKLEAERAAKRVHGVRAVANDLEVRMSVGRTDANIAAEAAAAFERFESIPESVQAAVHHGHVTLTGTVSWLYQKVLAEQVVAHVPGVRHVIDRIDISPPYRPPKAASGQNF